VTEYAAPAESGAAVVLLELDGLTLARALKTGLHQLFVRQEHLNKINVFPVPDGDTGTNLALTAGAILNVALREPEEHAGNVLTRVADAALDGARGNSGAILAQFLLGAGDSAAHESRLTTRTFAAAVASGSSYARDSMTDPREGTMLTVMADYAAAVARSVAGGDADDFIALLENGLATARTSLAHTPELLESLRKANVVDAGAEGFVEVLAGFSAWLASGSTADPDVRVPADLDEAFEPTAGAAQDLTHRYCTECVVNAVAIDRRRLRERLSAIGSSLIVGGSQTKVKLHVHVNEPARVFAIAREYGELTGEKADDMQRQQHSAHVTGRRVVISTDSAADMPEDVMERLDIHMVPVRVHFGERSYLDKVGITPEEFFAQLAASEVPPKTSQPPPGDFRRQFEFLASHYPQVVSINLTAEVSGTYNSAKVAAGRVQSPGRVTVVDSRNASLGQGLLVIDAAECAQAGWDAPGILRRLADMIPKTRTFALVGSLDQAVRGGRVPRGAKVLADLLRLMPVLASRPGGRVGAGGVLLGRRHLAGKFARFVLRQLDPARTYRVAVGHANAEEEARRLLDRLQRALPHVDATYVAPTGSALGVHGGPGMLVVGVQEYTPPRVTDFSGIIPPPA
jgi:DegV family protein with EDD domain